MRIGLIGPLQPSHTGRGVAETIHGTKVGLEQAGHEVVFGDINADVDIWYAYTTGALRQVIEKPEPKVCALVDLDHLVPLYRRQYDRRDLPMSYSQVAYYHALGQKIKAEMLELLGQADLVIEHAAHHAKWLQEQGIDTQYIPMPIVDPGSPIITDKYVTHPLRIVMAGHVTGIATLAGLYYLEENILPLLEVMSPPGSFEVHICGGDQLPKALQLRFARYHPAVKIRGYVEDIGAEFRLADVLLVPTPIDLGFRTRIVDGFAHGCLVVAHAANNLGMPEMVHAYNAFVSDNPIELVRGILEMVGRDTLTARKNARSTFEKHFNARVSVPPIVQRMEDLLGRKS